MGLYPRASALSHFAAEKTTRSSPAGGILSQGPRATYTADVMTENAPKRFCRQWMQRGASAHALVVRALRLASWGAGLAACLVAATWCGGLARADEAGGVVITGEVVPEAPNHFRWIIRNDGTGNIVSFRAPRHLGQDAVMPPRWSYELPKGATETSGEVLYRADAPVAGIGPGETGTFEIHDLRLQRVGRTKRAADVVVGFADGTELVISGVLCPAEETIVEKNIPLFGLGGMFAIFLIAQAVRKRRRGAAQAGPS